MLNETFIRHRLRFIWRHLEIVYCAQNSNISNSVQALVKCKTNWRGREGEGGGGRGRGRGGVRGREGAPPHLDKLTADIGVEGRQAILHG